MNQPSSQHYPTSDAVAPAAPHGGGKGWIFVVIIVLLAAGGGTYLYRSRKAADAAAAAAKGAAADRAIPVVLATVERKDVAVYLDGLGNALPTNTVTVHTQVDGPLSTVNFKEGQFVHKGDVIAQIDPRPFLATLHSAEAALSRDQATLKNAQLNLERYRELSQQKLIAIQQYTDQRALADSTIGTVKTDEAQIESARLNVEYSRIVSPIDGVTGVRLIDPGNIVHAADAGGLVVITQLDPMTVLFTLPEDDLPRVQLELAKGPLTVDAYSRDGSIKLGSGTLTFIDNQINQTTATIRLRASFANAKSILWPNEFVKARLLLSTEKNAIVIPAVAVQRGPTGMFVYVVGSDMTSAMRPIELSSLQGDSALVKKGLEAGDVVVADGQNQLKPGSKVAPREAEKGSKDKGEKSAGEPGGAPSSSAAVPGSKGAGGLGSPRGAGSSVAPSAPNAPAGGGGPGAP
jgi:multidrug efflux system membrane fusion protein